MAMENPDIHWIWYTLPFILLYALGVSMGARKQLVVYRNYNDIFIVGLLFIFPIIYMTALFFLIPSEQEKVNPNFLYFFIAVESLIGLLVLGRAIADNKNPLKLLLALYVKVPTGILFFLHLYNVFAGDRAASRRSSIFWSLMLLPLLYALVCDKETGMTPRVPWHS